MKTYHEMAQNVMERAQVRVARRRRVCAAISAVSVGCLAVLMTCVFAGGGTSSVPPSAGGESLPMRQYFLQTVYYSNGELSVSDLDQTAPMQFMLEATDVYGCTEEEIEQLRKEKTQALSQVEQTWAEEGYAYRISSVREEDALVLYAITGGFCLDVEDWSKVKEVRGRCESAYGKIQCAIYASAQSKKEISYRLIDEDGTEHRIDKPVYHHGNCWIYGQNVIIPGDSLRGVYEDIQRGEGSLLFSWEPNQALFEALAEDADFDLPRTPFSFTLCYEDGTEIEHKFIAESHDGVGYITCVD